MDGAIGDAAWLEVDVTSGDGNPCSDVRCACVFGKSGDVGGGEPTEDIGDVCNSRDMRLEVTVVAIPALWSARSRSAMLPPLFRTGPSASSPSVSLQCIQNQSLRHVETARHIPRGSPAQLRQLTFYPLHVSLQITAISLHCIRLLF